MALALVMVPVSAVITTQGARAAATFTTLYSFCSQSGCTDGKGGGTQLIQATDGNLYGTTSHGGTHGSYGTAFTTSLSGPLTTLDDMFLNSRYPGLLIQGRDGNFYGK